MSTESVLPIIWVFYGILLLFQPTNWCRFSSETLYIFLPLHCILIYQLQSRQLNLKVAFHCLSVLFSVSLKIIIAFHKNIYIQTIESLFWSEKQKLFLKNSFQIKFTNRQNCVCRHVIWFDFFSLFFSFIFIIKFKKFSQCIVRKYVSLKEKKIKQFYKQHNPKNF